MNRSLVTPLVLALAATAQGPATPGPTPPPTPGVRTKTCAVTVSVVDGVATTTVRQEIANTGSRQAEAVWLVPLPEGAVADGFSMTAGGTKMDSEVLSAGKARGIYQSIVRRRRDPGLLEYVGRGCLRARVFPIPAGGSIDVEVTWRQILTDIGGVARWRFAAAACGVDGRAPEKLTLDFRAQSKTPIRNSFAPSNAIEILTKGEREIRASFEGRPDDLPDGEVAVFWGLSKEDFGVHMLSHKPDGEDGYFLMMLAPKREWPDAKVLKKSITFVVDTSGSMRGRKLEQAKGALENFVRSLKPDDRFDVVTFSTDAASFFGGTVPASEANIATALERSKTIEAVGGTNIGAALKAGLPDSGPSGQHVPMCVFLTDGEATVGIRGTKQLLETTQKANEDKNARLFVFGVGHDLNTELLDKLAGQTRGTRHYVRENEDIEEKASALFRKLSNPVLGGLALELQDAQPSRMAPGQLGDLFAGDKLIVTGRFAKSGTHAIRLKGNVQGVEREYVYEAPFADGANHDFVAKIWAERRVAMLLDAMRLDGSSAELMQEVTHLGKKFGIVTPYTSHLIVEDGLGVSVPNGRGRRIIYRGPGNVMPPNPGGGGGTHSTPGPTGPSSPGAGGPATGGPTGPARGGPATGGLAGPAKGRPAGRPVASGADDFFLGGGAYRGPGDVIPPNELASALKRAGLVDKDAKQAQVDAVVGELVRELQRSSSTLARLDEDRSGKQAVSNSTYLAAMMRGEKGESMSIEKLLAQFVRRVEGKTFVLRAGIWTDKAFDQKTHAKRTKVEAFSDAYFELVAEKPKLKPFLAMSSRLIVVLDSECVEIFEKADDAKSRPDAGDAGKAKSVGSGGDGGR